MPIPLVIAGVAAVSSLGGALAAGGAKSVGAAYLKRTLSRHTEEIERWALSNVFEKMGLPDLMGESLNRHSFTQAVNTAFLSGQDFQLTNLFDAEAVKNDAIKFGLLQVADQAGLNLETVSINGMRDAIRAWIMQLVEDELLMDEVGELAQDARDVYEIIQLYKKYKKAEQDGEAAEAGGRKPLINTPEAAANRERQARYRANHKRVWTSK